jgi:putative salt-induced outer membrane protein
MKTASIAIAVAMGLGISQPVVAADGEWDSTVAAGLNVTSGNSETLAANAAVTAERVGDVHEIRLGIEGNTGDSEIDGVDETTTQNAKAQAVYKYKLNGSYLYSDNSIFHDDIADIEYLLIVGVGVGYRVVDTERAKLGLEIGVAYVEEELDDGTKDDKIAGRLAVRHDQTLSEQSKCWFSAEYLPSVDDMDDYLLNGEAGVEASLNSTLSLRVVVQDRYDSTVPVDREHNDLSVISSLVYTL